MNPDYLNAWQFQGVNDLSSTGLTPEQEQHLIDGGLLSKQQREYSNEGGMGSLTDYTVNWDKMPRMGPADWNPGYGNFMPANPGSLANSSLVYNDPNYGAITPTYNDKTNWKNGYDWIGPAYAALLTAGVGMLASPAAAGAAGLTRAIPNITSAAVHWSEALGGGAAAAPAATTAAKAAEVPGGVSDVYNPGLYGNMGSMAAPPDGSAPVATGIAPDAYANSNYNQVIG